MLFDIGCVLVGVFWFFVYWSLDLFEGFCCIWSAILEIYGYMLGNLVPELCKFGHILRGYKIEYRMLQPYYGCVKLLIGV